MKLLGLSLVVVSVGAYQPTRREIFRQAFGSAAITGAAFLPVAANAMEACPSKSKNCIVTEWTAPEGTSAEEMAKAVQAVISSYPQEGQSDVDKGGWSLIEENFSSGKARYEFKSGIGNFAKFFNGGKPFTDDLVVEIEGNKAIVKSSSRVGESDFGVNQKRLQFLASKIKAIGWTAGDPDY